MIHYRSLDYYNDLIMDNVTVLPNMINQTDIYDALEILEDRLTKYVRDYCIDEYAILMQEVRSQLRILLYESLQHDCSEEIKRLEYITSINILIEESKESSQS